MACERYYKDYFNIDPKYYAAVTADLIREGKVDWKSFYPHETFVKLLEKTHMVLSGMEPKSLWVEGAYGTGKSHAALTVKCLLEAPDEEVQEYFKDYGLSIDLCNKLIADEAILSLPPKQAKRCYDHYYQGFKLSDIAQKEGVTAGSVSECIKSALSALRERCNFFNFYD